MRGAGRIASAITVRVIEYTVPEADGVATRYRLLTSLLDEKHAPALELAAVYHECWEVDGVFDELKTHLHQRRRVLRSKTPDLVRQEFYAWVLAHYAVRWLMFSAATAHALPPRKLSFVANLQLLRRTQPLSGDSPPPARPQRRKRGFQQRLCNAATLYCTSSRGLSNPRRVKRQNSPFPSHDRSLLLNQKQIRTPAMLPPLPLSRWRRGRRTESI